MKKLSPAIQRVIDALSEKGVEVQQVNGGSHTKLFLNGKLVGIHPRRGGDSARRACLNVANQIRRAARDIGIEV